jgi:hypothetical protein
VPRHDPWIVQAITASPCRLPHRRSSGKMCRDSRRPSYWGARHPPSTPGARAACPIETHITCHSWEQSRDISIIIYRTSGDTHAGRRKSGILAISPSLPLSLSRVSDPCPLAYKRKGEDPHRGDGFWNNIHSPTHHFATRDLGARSLSRRL